MDEKEALIREVMEILKLGELHRPALRREFERRVRDWKARAEVAIGAAPAETFHLEQRSPLADAIDEIAGAVGVVNAAAPAASLDDPDDVTECTPCENGTKNYTRHPNA